MDRNPKIETSNNFTVLGRFDQPSKSELNNISSKLFKKTVFPQLFRIFVYSSILNLNYVQDIG
jgi:hypothetical protein